MSFEGDIVDCTVTSRKNRGMLPFERAIIVVFAMGELVLENRKSSDSRVGEKRQHTRCEGYDTNHLL